MIIYKATDDYNERSIEECFDMMPVVAQQFLDYVQHNQDGRFKISVDIPHGTVSVRNNILNQTVLYYSDLSIMGLNVRELEFSFGGSKNYKMRVYPEFNEAKWLISEGGYTKEIIDCQTFMKYYDKFKNEFGPEYFN